MAIAAETPVSPPDHHLPENLLALLPHAEDETGFRPRFGRYASDGLTPCGAGSFTLTDGVAPSHGGMGLWWHTNRVFTNFVIRGEWRFENPKSDTGVFVRCANPGRDPRDVINSDHELELGDDPEGNDPTWRTGTLYPFQPPANVPTKPVGKQNACEFIAIGQTDIIRINGEPVTVWINPKQPAVAGHIGLQNYAEGEGAQHRHLRIKELPC